MKVRSVTLEKEEVREVVSVVGPPTWVDFEGDGRNEDGSSLFIGLFPSSSIYSLVLFSVYLSYYVHDLVVEDVSVLE